MIPVQIVFLVTAFVTVAAGLGAAAIAIYGDTKSNAGQRFVVEKFAQIALLGATAIAAMLTLPL